MSQNNQTDRPRYMRPATCGREIDRSAGHIYDLIAHGQLRAFRVRGSEGCRSALRIRAEDWEAWLRANVVPVDPNEVAEDED